MRLDLRFALNSSAVQWHGIGTSFSPSSLFAASEPGVWYDPSDIERYMATGPELVSNGDFSSGSTGWTLGTGWSVSSGVASVVAPGTTTDLSASITLTAGRTYRVSCTISNYTAGSITPRFTGGTSAIGSNFPLANGTFTQLLTANTGNNGLTIRANSTADLSVDNISVTELVNYSTATMFQDSAGTTPVTEVEQPVGLIYDRSGRGNHASQTTSASRPVLKQDGNGSYYLSFDGVDDFLQTSTITPGTDKVQVFAGLRKASDAARGIVIESSTTTSNAGTFSIEAPSVNASPRFNFFSGGTVSVGPGVNNAIYAAPNTRVLAGLGDISGDNAILRIDSTQVSSVTTDQGTGNYLAYPLYIGRRGGTSLPFNGNLYSLIVRFGANLDASTIGNAEAWVNGKTRAY